MFGNELSEMDERVTTARIIQRMTDPRIIEQRRIKKEEDRRIEVTKNKLSL